MVSDSLELAKQKKEVTKMQLEREETELKYSRKLAKEAIAVADDALRKEESADDDRKFEAKVTAAFLVERSRRQ